jgi:hypothetical protein
MTDDFERRLANELRRAPLPRASDALRDRVRAIPSSSTPGRRSASRPTVRGSVLLVAAAMVGAVTVLAIGSGAVNQRPMLSPNPSGNASAATAVSPEPSGFPATVDGRPVFSVAEVLAQRAAGGLLNQPVVIAGYWSAVPNPERCEVPGAPSPGELEMFCLDGYAGITDRDELIAGPASLGSATPSHGAALTPYFWNIQDPTATAASWLFHLPSIDGQPFPPVPIVAVGHFDDPLAAKCRPAERQLCRDRLVLDDVVQFDPRAVTRPTPTSIGSVVDGTPVLSVGEVLSERALGGLRNQRVVVRGYWSDGTVVATCVPTAEKVGALEIRCADGEFGITERDEPIFAVDQSGRGMRATGPALTPYLDESLSGLRNLFVLPAINGQRFPPVPIVVTGHFDDPRAADCNPARVKLCQDRLVVDEILEFDALSVPDPAPTPSPTPFPFADPPPALFSADTCAPGQPFSFVGWTTLASFGIPKDRPDEGAYVVITRDAIPLADWSYDRKDGRYRLWGRRMCYALERDGGAIVMTAVPGSEFREYPNGSHQPVSGP